MEMYELMPTDGRKSFYNKAVVKIDDNEKQDSLQLRYSNH